VPQVALDQAQRTGQLDIGAQGRRENHVRHANIAAHVQERRHHCGRSDVHRLRSDEDLAAACDGAGPGVVLSPVESYLSGVFTVGIAGCTASGVACVPELAHDLSAQLTAGSEYEDRSIGHDSASFGLASISHDRQ